MHEETRLEADVEPASGEVRLREGDVGEGYEIFPRRSGSADRRYVRLSMTPLFSNVIDVYIRYLRRKIDDPFERKLIHTRRGIGYVLSAEP